MSLWSSAEVMTSVALIAAARGKVDLFGSLRRQWLAPAHAPRMIGEGRGWRAAPGG
jgi:hypothetical protein